MGKSLKSIVVKDGEELCVVAEVPTPSVFDAVGSYPAVFGMFRVVAQVHGNILALVPLTPVNVASEEQLQRWKDLETQSPETRK